MTLPIPTTIDDVDAEWLASATGRAITAIEVEQIGVGIGVSSALYRVHCQGRDCPTTLVVKLPALDDAAVFTSTMLRMYIREAQFFAGLFRDVPVRVPDGYHAAVDPETSSFVVVMEDMGELRAVDQIEGMGVGDAERCVDTLARWHAAFWGRAEALAENGTTVSLADPIYPAVLPVVFQEGWEKLSAELDLADSIARIGPAFPDALAGLLHDLAEAPTTMTHGDFRADNILFDADDEPVLLDFQLLGTGSGAYDLAYFVTQSLSSETARTHERALFDRWRDGLASHGVADDGLDRMWTDYRKAALFCLAYPVVASRGMDFDDPRQRALVEAMNDRFARAVDDLDLAALL